MTTATDKQTSVLFQIISQNEDKILAEWIQEMSSATRRDDLIKNADLRVQCSNFLRLTRDALNSGGGDFESSAFDGVRQLLEEISRSRAQQGFTPTETAAFVFSA